MNDREEIKASKELLEIVPITDVVYLSDNQTNELLGLWGNMTNNESQTPSDIFFQDTIPLRYLTFYTHHKKVDVVIFPHLKETISEFINDDEYYSMVVGVIRLTDTNDMYNIPFYFDLHLSKDYMDIIVPLPIGAEIWEFNEMKKDVRTTMYQIGRAVLGVWYSIQICLLNPITKVIFANPKSFKLHGKDKINAQRGSHIVKYIKHYYVRDEDIDNALYGGDKSFNRKCLVWYVTGHWRQYKDGKRTFIKGYWKGALRNTPHQDSEPRKREIVINESEGEK